MSNQYSTTPHVSLPIGQLNLPNIERTGYSTITANIRRQLEYLDSLATPLDDPTSVKLSALLGPIPN